MPGRKGTETRVKIHLAAPLQLSVPVLAALGGIVFLGEPITLRLAFASTAILGGIALVVLRKHKAAEKTAGLRKEIT